MFGALENIYQNLENVKPPRIAGLLETHRDIVRRETGERGGGQRLHLPRADVTPIAGMAADAGMDERDLHGISAATGASSRPAWGGAMGATGAVGNAGARPMIQSQL